MKIVVHNDDFGLNYGFSEAIIDCHKNGVTTSTSVRVDGTAYKATMNSLKKNKKLGVGLHLNLTDGQDYNRNFLSYLLLRKSDLKIIEKSLESQFIEIIKKDKIMIDHVNGHDHIHMIPDIFKITAKLCKKYGIKYLRVVNENYYLTGSFTKDIKPFLNINIFKFILLKIFSYINMSTLKKYSLKSVPFYGILHTDNMNEDTIIAAVENAKINKYDTIEILTHPVYKSEKDKTYTSEFIKKYSNKTNRTIEANALKSKRIKNYFRINKIKLINYAQI